MSDALGKQAAGSGILTPEQCPPALLVDYIAPNVCFRSPLFGVVAKNSSTRNKPLRNLLVVDSDKLTITYSGSRLTQGDLDILLLLLRTTTGKRSDSGHMVISLRAMSEEMGLSFGRSARQQIHDSITRLASGLFQVKVPDPDHPGRSIIYGSTFIHEFIFSEEHRCYKVALSDRLAKLFELGWSRVYFKQRITLKGDLTKWLHGYLGATNLPGKQLQIGINKIRDLCGSDISRPRDFARKLRMSMDILVEKGAVVEYRMDSQGAITATLAGKKKNEKTTKQQPKPASTTPEPQPPQGSTPSPVEKEPVITMANAEIAEPGVLFKGGPAQLNLFGGSPCDGPVVAAPRRKQTVNEARGIGIISQAVDEVFNHWKAVMGHPRARIGNRDKLIRDRLREGYTVDDLKFAIDGCKRSPFHQGDNKDGTIYDGLHLICRDATHVDQFIAKAQAPETSGLSMAGRKTLAAAMELIAEKQQEGQNAAQ